MKSITTRYLTILIVVLTILLVKLYGTNQWLIQIQTVLLPYTLKALIGLTLFLLSYKIIFHFDKDWNWDMIKEDKYENYTKWYIAKMGIIALIIIFSIW